MAVLGRGGYDKTIESNERSVDQMFQTLKSLKESEDKAKQASLEHVDRVNATNLQQLSDAVAGKGGIGQIDPVTGKVRPFSPEELATVEGARKGQAAFKTNQMIEQLKAYQDYSSKLESLNQPKSPQVATVMGKPVTLDKTAIGGVDMDPVANQMPKSLGPSVSLPKMIPSFNSEGEMSLKPEPAGAKAIENRNKIAEANRNDRLEDKYISRINAVVSSNQKPAGLQNSKVNQGIALRTLVESSYDPKTGNYNIPPAQHTELALGLARMLSPTGQVHSDIVKRLEQGTLRQKLSDIAIYFGGDPKKIGGTTQSITKYILETIDREAIAAEGIRDKAIEGTKQQYQSGLSKEQRDRLSKVKIVSSYKDMTKDYSSPEDADSSGLPEGTIVKVQGRRYQI